MDTETVDPGYDASQPRDSREDDTGGSTSVRLFIQAQQGRTSAMDRLFARLIPDLREWARGRLPSWARARLDTEDLVQEAFAGVFRRRGRFEPRRKQAIRSYLKRSILNRIRDEVRRAGKVETHQAEGADPISPEPSPLDRAVTSEHRTRYLAALARVPESDQRLIVGRIDLDYSYEQLALATGRTSADAARMAVRRALVRLAREMGSD